MKKAYVVALVLLSGLFLYLDVAVQRADRIADRTDRAAETAYRVMSPRLRWNGSRVSPLIDVAGQAP